MLLNYQKRLEIRKTKEFRASNRVWNDLNLNHRSNIGSVMYLAKLSRTKSYDDWVKFYFKSGEERLKLRKNYKSLDELVKINQNYGRTEEELIEIAKTLSIEMGISLELAYNYVYIRVIDETWLGLRREEKAFNLIKKELIKYKMFRVEHSDVETDFEYAVDYEIKKDGNTILGIQLKSSNYLVSSKIKYVKDINQDKNHRYTQKYGVPVLYLYMNQDQLINVDELVKFLQLHNK